VAIGMNKGMQNLSPGDDTKTGTTNTNISILAYAIALKSQIMASSSINAWINFIELSLTNDVAQKNQPVGELVNVQTKTHSLHNLTMHI
jgi:hypothetical protein